MKKITNLTEAFDSLNEIFEKSLKDSSKKKSLKESSPDQEQSDQLQPFVVRFGWDSGGPENGPSYGYGEDIVYAASKEDACSKWESENQEQIDGFNSAKYGGYEGCFARPATEDDIREYNEYIRMWDEPDTYIESFRKKTPLKEARWSYTLKSGSELRSAIEDEDPMGVIFALQNAYAELRDAGLIDEDDFDSYTGDFELYEEDDDDIEETADYELDNFYDLCDALKVWIPLD